MRTFHLRAACLAASVFVFGCDSLGPDRIQVPEARASSAQSSNIQPNNKYPGRPTKKGSFAFPNTVCPVDPTYGTPDYCSLVYQVIDEDQPMATDGDTAAPQTLPLWTGQYADQIAGDWVCPSRDVDPIWRVYIPEDAADVFFIAPIATFFRYTGTRGGYPTGEYILPPGDFYSFVPSFRYGATGGHLFGICKVKQVRDPLGRIVEIGLVTWYDYSGTVFRRTPTGSTEFADRGWAYHDNFAGSTSGQSSGLSGGTPQSVVERFIESGACTAGWEIWVDGAKRCRADGTAV